MPSAADAHRSRIAGLSGPALEADLLAHSGLPGPRANLELLGVVAALVPDAQLLAWSRLGPDEAANGTAREYLAVCGVTGIGRLLRDAPVVGRPLILSRLAEHARDPRWRIRESVAMALQFDGRAAADRLVGELGPWCAPDDRLRQRAVVAGLCEPALLREPETATTVLGHLDRITTTIVAAPDRRNDDFRILRQALGYGWSVAIAALPTAGLPLFERWVDEPDQDVRWMVRENLGKTRLRRADAQSVDGWLLRLGLPRTTAR